VLQIIEELIQQQQSQQQQQTLALQSSTANEQPQHKEEVDGKQKI